MSRTAFAASALLLGLSLSACADHRAPHNLSAAAAEPAQERCGDVANPCMLEGIKVSATYTQAEEAAVPANRS